MEHNDDASGGVSTVLLTVAYDSGMDERIMETLQEIGVSAGPRLSMPMAWRRRAQTELACFPRKRHSALDAAAGSGNATDRRRPARPSTDLSPQPRNDDVDDAREVALSDRPPETGKAARNLRSASARKRF